MMARKLLYRRDSSMSLDISLPLVSSCGDGIDHDYHHDEEFDPEDFSNDDDSSNWDLNYASIRATNNTDAVTTAETTTTSVSEEEPSSSVMAFTTRDHKTALGLVSSPASWIITMWGRLVLFLLAVVYGSLNVSMRMIFARPNPPTPSASSTIQGWFAVLCFWPLLWWEKTKRHKEQQQQQNQLLIYQRGQKNTHQKDHKHQTPTWRTLVFGDQNYSSSSIGSHELQKKLVWFALELALWNFGTQALINTSLLVTHGARASFLVTTSVVWTPIVSIFTAENEKLQKQQQGRRMVVWLACALALAGTWVISQGENGDVNDDDSLNDNDNANVSVDAEGNSIAEENNEISLSWSLSPAWGDACCLLAGLCWSLYICRLSASGDSFDETTTQFVKNIILATLYTLWMLASFLYNNHIVIVANSSSSDTAWSSLWKGWDADPMAWGILFYTALGPCTIADVCQQKAQASVPAAEANVILSMEPVFTTLLGLFVLGEQPSQQELMGGILILVASILAAGCGPQPPSSLPPSVSTSTSSWR
uniref:EamA domain-containing protein n=1 Tax=Pseudo-nitzschia australis TaxID=44445 RepID=A0A7S4EI90_9STRA